MHRTALRLVLLALFSAVARAHPGTEVAIEDLTELIRAAPATAELHVRRALCYVEHARWAEAQADLDRAAAITPRLPDLALARAEYHAARGEFAAAISALEPAVRERPKDPALLTVRARALAALGRRVEAAADFRCALAALPEPKPELWLEANRVIADPAAALADLDLGIRRLGPAPGLVERALELELALHRTDAALARLARLALTAERPEFFLKRQGDILRASGRATEARTAYGAALAAIGRLPDWLRASESTQALLAQLSVLINAST